MYSRYSRARILSTLTKAVRKESSADGEFSRGSIVAWLPEFDQPELRKPRARNGKVVLVLRGENLVVRGQMTILGR